MARAFLERKGLESARLEAELLVGHALGVGRLQLFMRLDQPLSSDEIDRARDLLVRRGRREPTAYIVGRREFYGRDFEVGPGVLVPRPETELIVDRGREVLDGKEAPRVLDIGTGSGCLAVTLALEVKGAEVHAIDVSGEALDFASRNAVKLDAEVVFHHGDGLELARTLAAEGRFDLVVSNPPYVEPGEAPELAEEVREHEPALALFAPEGDPDLWARELARLAPELLAPGGRLLVELGHLQGARAAQIAGAGASVHEDLDGVQRVLEVG